MYAVIKVLSWHLNYKTITVSSPESLSSGFPSRLDLRRYRNQYVAIYTIYVVNDKVLDQIAHVCIGIK